MDTGTSLKRKKQKKKGRASLTILLVVIYLLLLCVAVVIVDRRGPAVRLNGETNITLEYGESYTDPGYVATTGGVLFGDIDFPLTVQVEGAVNDGELGTYVVSYSTEFLWQTAVATRMVTIRDTTPPVIELSGNGEATWLNGYAEEGYLATDLHDGDITAAVDRDESEDSVTYTVADSSGNAATVTRELHYTATEPEIQLLGDAQQHVSVSRTYEDPGCRACDNTGADLSERIVTEGEVNPLVPGTYTLTYSIENSRGQKASAVRNVTVEAIGIPETEYPYGKTIYLTFDDGPGPYTARLLDILKKYNVKATFFVTNCNTDYTGLIAREYNEGHSVAVHTYCHDYNTIYASDDAYLDDFFAMQEVVYQQTGSYSRLFRFPGGSSNTVSRINEGIVTRLAQYLTDMGYVYFDWNVDSNDAGGAKKPDEVLENVIEGCSERNVCVVLQHDIKEFSVDAVEQIILWGKANGYTFAALDVDSPTARHNIRN